MTLIEAVLSVAKGELGVTETAKNAGPKVDEYLASVGTPSGQPWCAAFLYWVFREAARIAQVANPCPRTASALRVWHKSPIECRMTRTAAPKVGDVVVLDHGKGRGHVAIVLEVLQFGKIIDISGNTNQQGSREGNAVAEHVYDPLSDTRGHLIGYVRFVDPPQPPPPLLGELPPSPFK